MDENPSLSKPPTCGSSNDPPESRRYSQETGKFTAKDPLTGTAYLLLVFTDYLDSTDAASIPHKELGRRIRTEEGLNVDALGNREYQIVENSILLVSDDPNAI